MPLVALGALAIGGSIAGGVMANKGANAQANAVKDASAAAVAEQQRQYDLNRQDLAPWRDSGGAANQKLAYLLGVGPNSVPGTTTTTPGTWSGGDINSNTDRPMKGNLYQYGAYNDNNVNRGTYTPGTSTTTQNFDPQGSYGSLMKDFTLSDFQADPGYNFRQSEGQKTLERSAAAKGNLFSGGTLKALDQYNQDFASNEFSNAYNRFNTNKLNRYNMLAGLSQGGQQATNTTVAAGTNAANNISNITMNAGEQIGNARASGYAGIGNAINSGIGGLTNLYFANKILK